MSKNFEGQFKDVGGGLNDSYDPSQLEAKYASRLVNFSPYGPDIARRNGIIRQTVLALSERVTGLFGYGKTLGEWVLIAGSLSNLSKINNGLPYPLPNLDSVVIPPADNNWEMKQYKGVGYAVRVGVPGLLRFTLDGFQLAGISAPTQAPVIAAVGTGTGVMEAGDRHIVMTYVNVNTDVESNPSPPSNVATLAALDSASASNLQDSPNPQVTNRRIYAELPNIQGQYYRAAEIGIGSSGPVIINKSIDQLGDLVSFKNAPPVRQEYVDIEIWKERLWITDGFDVFFSQNLNGIGLAECFSATDFIEIYPDDRNHVTAMEAFGERLIVGKSNGIHAILVSGSSFEVQTISDKQGCIAGGSMRSAEGLLFWYSGDNVYQTNGSTVEAISDPAGLGGSRIRKLLDSVPDQYKSQVRAAIQPRLGWYMIGLPTGDSQIPTHTAVYDYRNRKWFVFTHSLYGAPTIFGDFLDSREQPRIYCAFYGSTHIYDFIGTEATETDDGIAINAEWRSAGSDCGAPGYLHVLHHGGLIINPINAKCTLQAFEDNSEVASVTRQNVSLSRIRPAQRISLPSVRSYHTQLGLLYSGAPRLVLHGAMLEADVWGYREQPE